MELRFGMVGGGNGAFIGDVHRHGAQMDDLAVLTAGCFTEIRRKTWKQVENGIFMMKAESIPTTGRWRKRRQSGKTGFSLW